jgi:hypothetical protein
MPSRGYLTGSPKGGTVTPLQRRAEATLRDLGSAAVARQLSAPPADPTQDWTQALLRPVLQAVADQVVQSLAQHGETPTADAVDRELAATLKRLSASEAIRSLRQGDHPPVPASATEAMAIAKGAVEVHQGAAVTALQVADLERTRRQEAESRVGAAAEAAAAEEASKWEVLLASQDRHHNTVLALVRDLASAQLQAAQANFQSTLAAINEKLDLKASADARERELRDQQWAQTLELERQRAAAALKEKEFEWRLQAAPRTESIEQRYQAHFVDHQAASWADERDAKRAEREVEKKRAEAAAKATEAFAEKVPELLDGAVRFFAGGAPLPDNGIPAVPPPPPEGLPA